MIRIIPLLVVMIALPISVTYSFEIVHLKFAILATCVLIMAGYILLHELKSIFDDKKNGRNDILD